MAPSISPSMRRVFIWSAASCSLILLMAKPTWTRTQSPRTVFWLVTILLANLAHGEADMAEDPVAGNGFVILQEAEINPAAHADYFDQSGILVIGGNLDDLSWYG